MTSETIIIAVELFVLLLAIAIIVGFLARRWRLPYTVGLVLVGGLMVVGTALLRQFGGDSPVIVALLELLDTVLNLEDDLLREIILGLLVPPLIFEAAFHLRFKNLLENWRPILLFAVPGVIITTFLVAGAITWGTGIPFATTVVFGALIAATDPVAVISLFRSMGVPKRVQVLMEGESLFNDGTAIVVFGIALSVAKGGSFTLVSGVLDFLLIAGGGVLIGIAAGGIASRLIARTQDYLLETALTLVLAYGAYFLAESVHVSGVLAVVLAGLISGNRGPHSMTPSARIVVANFWELLAFVANSLVFLLIGLAVRPELLLGNSLGILYAILAVVAARAIVIYGFSAVLREIPLKWQVILHWGGLRGAISLALALGLGAGFADIKSMAFGVVLFTLLVQGLTMGPLVRRLRLGIRNPVREAYNLQQARAVAIQAAVDRVEALYRSGIYSEKTWTRIKTLLGEDIRQAKEGMKNSLAEDPVIAAEELDRAWREALQVQRAALVELFSTGAIDEETLEGLVVGIDTALQKEQIAWEDLDDMRLDLAQISPESE